MAANRPYLFIASMDVDAAHEALFHEVYDREHVPFLSEVPGVRAIERYEVRPFALRIGGALTEPPLDDQPRFSAVYRIDGPDVLTSPAWDQAIERGRWASDVRPFTTNRRHLLLRPLGEAEDR